jgi:hypothetical protein
MFQHIAGCNTYHYWQGGLAITNLRTVIVTAAVYRGFGSKLRTLRH